MDALIHVKNQNPTPGEAWDRLSQVRKRWLSGDTRLPLQDMTVLRNQVIGLSDVAIVEECPEVPDDWGALPMVINVIAGNSRTIPVKRTIW
jgi:hypothetical protein